MDKPLVNMLSSFVTSNKADSLNIRVITDGINSRDASVDNVEDAGRQTCKEN